MLQSSYHNSNGQPMTRAAFYALKAATMRQQVGNDAARRHAINNGSTPRLYRLACQLLAAQRAALLDFTQPATHPQH